MKAKMQIERVIKSQKGLVVAPAGCGKTHLIIDSISEAKPEKPYLVLTHTTAGVTALRQKFKERAIPSSYFKIATIDGWALRVANMFPVSCLLSNLNPNQNHFYDSLRANVFRYIEQGNISELIQATYSKLLVDEYQDCSWSQHWLVVALSKIIPTVVFGDPMQTIFDFEENNHPDWDIDVIGYFPLIVELNEPWRWIKSETECLGEWILEARNQLRSSQEINLAANTEFISWNQLTTDKTENIQNQNAALVGNSGWQLKS